MSAAVFVCEGCERAVFPHRLLCPDCGGRYFRTEEVQDGVLVDFADRGDAKVGVVRVAQGPLLIVRVEGDPERGSCVALDLDGDVPVARR